MGAHLDSSIRLADADEVCVSQEGVQENSATASVRSARPAAARSRRPSSEACGPEGEDRYGIHRFQAWISRGLEVELVPRPEYV